MHWFDVPHALLVILIVSQISVGLSNEELEENSTLEPTTLDPTSQEDATVDEQKITRRFAFKRPPASAYQPTKHRKPKHNIQELLPAQPPPQYAASWPVVPVATVQPMAPPMAPAMAPPMAMPMPVQGPMLPSMPMVRPRPRPRPRPMQSPAPSLAEFLPSAISGLTNMLTAGGKQPSNGDGGLGPLGDLLGPLAGLIKPGLGLLGPLAKTLAGALPFGKTLLDLFETIKKIMSFFTDFSITKLIKGLFSCVPRIIKAICGMFDFIPKMIDRFCRLFNNIFGLIPKTLMLIPKLFKCLHKIPERLRKCIELLYRFCKTIEMFLSFLKQALWNMLRLLGNTVLLPLRIISKTIAEVIHLPIKLLSEPFLAFMELMRAILYPFRKLYHYLLSRLDYIVGEVYILVKWIFGGSPRTIPTGAVVPAPIHIPLIRVFPQLSSVPRSPLAAYILSKR